MNYEACQLRASACEIRRRARFKVLESLGIRLAPALSGFSNRRATFLHVS